MADVRLRRRAPAGSARFQGAPPFRRAPVWTFRAHALLEFPPVIAYSRIYIVNNSGTVFALHQQSGKGPLEIPHPSLLGGLAGCRQPSRLRLAPEQAALQRLARVDGKVIAFDAETGRIRWQRTIGPSESSPLVRGRHGDRRRLVARHLRVHGSVGEPALALQGRGLVKGAISQSGNRVYFGAYDTHVYALDLHTGKQIWRASSQPRIGRTGTFYANAAVAYGRVYIGATDGKMYSFGATTGKLRWSNGTGDFIYSSAAVWRGNVLVGSYDGYFYSFDAATGDIRWRFHAGAKISGSASVIDGVVYFSTLSGRTFGLNARNGKLVWSYLTGSTRPRWPRKAVSTSSATRSSTR